MGDYLLTTLSSSAGAAILISAVAFLFRNIIQERLKGAIRHEYDVDIKKLESDLRRKNDIELEKLDNKLSMELEVTKIKIGTYSERQFNIYNELWVSLLELKYSMLKLWGVATEEALGDFSKKLAEATNQLERSALLIEETHYVDLMNLLNIFSYYEIGKLTLIDYKHEGQNSVQDRTFVQKLIEDNRVTKDMLLASMQKLMVSLRNHIKGNFKA